MLEFNFNPFPTIRTERLVLRQITPADAQDLFRMRSDARVMKYISKPLQRSIDEAHRLIELMQDGIDTNSAITWGISTQDSNELIGTMGFWRIYKEHHRAEIGYMLDADHWRKGYISEAIQAAIQYAFNDMKLHSIEANVHPDNTGSRQLLEKHGFVQEAYFKENYYFDGRFEDSVIFSLLNRN
jgi:ribosomal-protein-alanine N-acetyltransferase